MRLSERIYKLADMIAHGEAAADVGTDHGYVPMLLIKNGISPRAVMTDISEGSLAKAKETFRLAGLEAADVDFRTGDGLEPLSYGETEALIIAGLGAYTIIDILSRDLNKSKSFSKLVLQPRKYSGVLRHFLYTHGFDINDEVLAQEGKFECEIISASPSACDERTAPYPEGDIRWKYPKKMIDNNPELGFKKIKWKMGSIDEQIGNLKDSEHDMRSLIEDLERDKEYLLELISAVK